MAFEPYLARKPSGLTADDSGGGRGIPNSEPSDALEARHVGDTTVADEAHGNPQQSLVEDTECRLHAPSEGRVDVVVDDVRKHPSKD